MEKIKGYIELIKKLSEGDHIIFIKRKNWIKRFPELKSDIIEWYKDDTIEISRGELFELTENKVTEEFVIKVLMWGYPTGGRGNNIKELLKRQNRKDIVTLLNKYKEKPFIKTEELKDGLEIKGLGLSTMSKFLYFLEIKIDNEHNRSVILDQIIIDVVNSELFTDFKDLKKITSYNAPTLYVKYLKKMKEIADDLEDCEVGQLEMFLFIFGNKFMLKLAHKLMPKTTEKG
jgi:hypothetical protein|tara:strand:- start:1000 stop:1692 length:693 start_codon:yes stop_codon:yes gene_type:complete